MQLGAATRPVTRQAGSIACQAGIVALDEIDRVASELPRHSTWCPAQMSGDGPDRVRGSHHHDGGSVFSSEMAIAVGHGNTVPDGLRLALGH